MCLILLDSAQCGNSFGNGKMKHVSEMVKLRHSRAGGNPANESILA
jgi:hypothetical protein